MNNFVTVYKDAIKPEMVQWLLKNMKRGETRGHSVGNTVYVPTKQFLQELQMKLYENLPFTNDIFDISYTHMFQPYGLHTDKSPGGKQGLIPLSWEGPQPYTLFFDQRCQTNAEWVPPALVGKVKQKRNMLVTDPSFFEGWSDQHKISDEYLQKYFGQKWQWYRDAYKGFSIQFAYQWNIGDLIAFDSTVMHCSSTNIEHKKGILFFIEGDDE